MSNSLRIHYIQHVPFEGLGYIEKWANEHHHSLSETQLYVDPQFPELTDFDWLIVLGGPMGVYDDAEFPWLPAEKAFIHQCIHGGKTMLGICLGAQLIAHCLGARVVQAQHQEVGWFPVFPTHDAKSIDWFYTLFQTHPTVFHWHADQFELPRGCTNLLVSAANANQAFCYGKKIIGLQFHAEMTEHTISEMLAHSAVNLIDAPFVQAIPDIQRSAHHVAPSNRLMQAILEKLAE